MRRNEDEQREFDAMLEEFKQGGGKVQVVTMDDCDMEVDKVFDSWYIKIGIMFAGMRRK